MGLVSGRKRLIFKGTNEGLMVLFHLFSVKLLSFFPSSSSVRNAALYLHNWHHIWQHRREKDDKIFTTWRLAAAHTHNVKYCGHTLSVADVQMISWDTILLPSHISGQRGATLSSNWCPPDEVQFAVNINIFNCEMFFPSLHLSTSPAGVDSQSLLTVCGPQSFTLAAVKPICYGHRRAHLMCNSFVV